MLEVQLSETVPTKIWQEIAGLVPADQRFLAENWIPAWIKAASRVPPAKQVIHFLGVDRSQVVGLMSITTFGFGPLRVPGLAGYYFPCRSVLAAEGREDEVAEAFVDRLKRIVQVGFRFGPLVSDYASMRSMLEAFRAARWPLIQRSSGNDFVVRLPDSIEKFRLETLSGKLRSNSSRQERRMFKEGQARFETYSGLSRPEWDKVIAEMGNIERESWVGQSGGFLHFFEAGNAAFWSEWLQDTNASHAARAFILYFNERPAAFRFCFDSGSWRYSIAALQSPTVDRYSAGYLLLQRMLEDAIARGLKTVNLGLGDPGHKSRFGAKPEVTTKDVVAFLPSLAGRTAATIWSLKQRIIAPKCA